MVKRPSLAGIGKDLLAGNDPTAPHPVRALMASYRDGQFIEVSLDALDPDPAQPRKHFDAEELENLADSIRNDGVLQAVLIRPVAETGRFTLIAGERRFRAAKLVGLTTIPALVRLSGSMRELAIIENIQRQDLTPLEEGEAYLELKAEARYSDEALARVLGKSRSTITEILSLTGLPEVIKADCRTSDNLTKSQLLQVLRAGGEEEQIALWEAVRSGRLPTVRAVREATKKPGAGRPKNFRHTYRLPAAKVSVTVSFQKTKATPDEIRAALQAAIDDLA